MDNIKILKSEILKSNESTQDNKHDKDTINNLNNIYRKPSPTIKDYQQNQQIDDNIPNIENVDNLKNLELIETNIKSFDQKILLEESINQRDRIFESSNKQKYLFRNALICCVCICLIVCTMYVYPYIKKPVSYLGMLSMGLFYPQETMKIFNEYADLLGNNSANSQDDTDTNKNNGKENVKNDLEEEESSSVNSSSQAEELPPLDKSNKGDGTVSVVTYKTAPNNNIIPLKSGFIKNLSHLSNKEVLKAAEKEPKFKLEISDEPQVLIMHTHATESYMLTRSNTFDTKMSFRSRNNEENMVAVGNIIAKTLNDAGIKTIQDDTLHDYPSYTGSYERSAKTVQSYLKKHPSIKVVLDVHRDGISNGKNEIIAPTVMVEGKEAAQIMIISGCDNGSMNMPNYMENLKFASVLQNQLESDYPNLTRPILFDYRKYNQDLTTGSILLEMGSHGNTIEQAKYSGELLAKSLIRWALDEK